MYGGANEFAQASNCRILRERHSGRRRDQVLRRSGYFRARDVSIVGFDNLEIAELTTPELTTLEVPARDMGRLAADYVLASPVQRKHLKERELPIRLVIRESSGPAIMTKAKRASAIRRR